MTATLERATFYASGNRTFNAFRGRVEPDRLTFHLASSSYDDGCFGLIFRPGDVLERLWAIPALLSVSGSVVLDASGSRRTGLLEGILATFSELRV